MNKLNRSARSSILLLATLMVGGCATTENRDMAASASASGIAEESKEVVVVPKAGSLEASLMPPVWTVGEQWEWSDGYGLKVMSVEDGITHFERTDVDDQWARRRAIFKEESQSAKSHRRVVFRSRDPMKLFPLEQGNRVSFMREYMSNQVLRVHRTSWEVKGKDTIKVPAGEFDCWVIEMNTRSTTGDWSGYERWWYSPEAKNYVRMEYSYGLSPNASRVLMSYSLNSGQAQ